MIEQIMRDYERAFGIRHVSLRYVNAAGADSDGEIGEDHDPETHLIPLVIQAAIGQRPYVEIYAVIRQSMVLLAGFCSGYFKGIPRVPDEEAIRYLRQQQIRRLRFGSAYTDNIETNHI